MTRSKRSWLLFSVCVAAVAGALVWLSILVVQLERADLRAKAVAEFEESVRLALWRMDSELAPVLAQEEARPTFHYRAFYPERRALAPSKGRSGSQEVLVPSPLLDFASDFIRVHFEVEETGAVTSPQVPTGDMRALAGGRYVEASDLNDAIDILHRAKKFVDYETLLAHVVKGIGESPITVAMAEVQGQGRSPPAAQQKVQPFRGKGQAQKTLDEAQIRRAARSNIRTQSGYLQQQSAVDNATGETPGVLRRGLTPVWVPSYGGEERELFFARAVTVDSRRVIQGFWASWPAIRRASLKSIRDLFPQARLVPCKPTDGPPSGRAMASIPATLDPGPAPPIRGRTITPVRVTLTFAWGAIAFTIVTVGLVLRAAIDLSERRGNFVSAVTHELRTPLTTFRLYSEMLADDMVRDDETRRQYLLTLRSEAERLSHLVENVLVFARVEDGRLRARREDARVEDILERCAQRVKNRVGRSEMEIVREGGTGDACTVRVDTEAVEQILFNLVDNSCKYANGADDRRIHVRSAEAGSLVEIRIWDHGPGVSAEEEKRIFEPFHRAEIHAAGPAPGVGLGLALSRRLAHAMGGTLELDHSHPYGATFVLSLPVVRDP